ncbi:hypothetical protein JHK86_053376 [Glycine max]|nr:hypothetical protein JHK86_053376 [Glycine max]
MSSSAAVHLQSPINHSSDAPPPHSPFLYFNADCLNPSAAAAASAARTRSRPRLAKLRKQSASQQARSWSRTSATGDDGSGACAGFNPFRSDQVTTGNVNNSGVESGSDGFVFAAGKGGSDSARDLKGPSEGEIGKSGGVEFVFSAKKRSEDELKKKMKMLQRRFLKQFGFWFEYRKGGICANNVEKPEHVGSVWNSDCGMGAFGVKMGGNGNSDAGADRCDHLGDECESRYDSLNGIAATYCDVPVRNLSDGMEKLNIKHSEGADIARDSANSHGNGSAGFVFGASDKVFGYSSVSSRTDADGQQSCAQATYENIGGQFAKVGALNGVQNRTACGVARGSAGIHCSKPSTCQEGTRDFQCGKIPECNVSEDLKVNEAAASFSFSPFGFDSHPNNHASMAIPQVQIMIRTEIVLQVLQRLPKSLLWTSNPHMGSFLAIPFVEGNGSQKTPDSSGIHSPMDFSPYQETTASDRVKASEKLNDLHSTMPTDRSGSAAGASADAGLTSSQTLKSKRMIFRFVHGVNDSKGKGFAFSASSSVDGTPSLKRQQKKKFRRKMGCNSFVNSPRVNGNFVSSVQFSPHNPANMSSHSDLQFRKGMLHHWIQFQQPVTQETQVPIIKEISSFIVSHIF